MNDQAAPATLRADVVVLGAGAAGVCAAISAAREGKHTVLIEAGPMPGGELLTGMAVDGAVNAHGEWVVGGVARELFDECRRLDGYIGALNDWRLIHYVCYDPEVMKLAVSGLLAKHGVTLLLHSFVFGADAHDGHVSAVHILNKAGMTRVEAPVFVDASGDGDLAVLAGARYQSGEKGQFQPVSIMFRMAGVDTPRLLDFVRSAPQHFALGESEAIRGGRTDAQIAEALREQGQPTVFLKGDGPLLAKAIEQQRLYPTALIMIQPTSTHRGEVCLNSTRVANIDATRTLDLSATLGSLTQQVEVCLAFMQAEVPGFEDARLSGLAPRIGIRETRRIEGDASLTESDVLRARKRPDGIGRGCHHVDIHQDGAGQVRIPVDGGGSYDIPWGALLPAGVANVVIAGRCVSADRPAHGSVRVMGPCMAMGQAAGTAAAMLRDTPGADDFRTIDVKQLRQRLRANGAILEGPR
ncbi:MAG: FAD-dependent oxidoreductase [Pigmentiphaga sp.]|nr:FAD-dependent oxidoreductase [Pigmentiphaga sp.]